MKSDVEEHLENRAPAAGGNATHAGGGLPVRERLRAKLRTGGVPRLLVDGLGRLGLVVMPFYIYCEDPAVNPRFDATRRDFEVLELGASDMAELARFPERTVPMSSLQERLAAGGRCLGLRCDGELAAFRWFHLRRCVFECYPFDLSADEAYVFDAYTAPAFRGRGIAMLLCAHLYRLLLADGRTRLYSLSHCFNREALRFKERLGARREMLAVYVRVLGGPSFTVRLPRYRDGAVRG